MDISILREYIVLSQTLNYTESAERLHLTQPTLSKHVAALEKELGCRLLERDRRHVALTEVGNVFAAAAMQIIDIFDEAQVRIGEIQASDPLRASGTLYDPGIAAITSIAATILDAKGHAPVEYSNVSNANYADQLLSGEVDLALAYFNLDNLESLGLSCAPLSRSRFVALVSLDNPIARLKGVSIDDLRNCRFIKFADGYAITGWMNIERVCEDHGFTPRTKTVLGRTSVNYCSVPLAAEDVVILQEGMPQLRYLSSYSRVAVVPVVDDDAVFRLYAGYKLENAERVKPVLEAYAAARRIIVNHSKGGALVESDA